MLGGGARKVAFVAGPLLALAIIVLVGTWVGGENTTSAAAMPGSTVAQTSTSVPAKVTTAVAESTTTTAVPRPSLSGAAGIVNAFAEIVTASEASALSVASDNTSAPNVTAPVVVSEGQTPLKGVWNGTADQLASFLLEACPSPGFTVPTPVLAEYYVRYCAEAGLRADLLWAQMIHETGYGMYGGDVRPEQNNYVGIGATGGGTAGASFPTAEAGVMAHVAHMVAYVYTVSPVSWADASTDPRFDMVSPRGIVSVLADLNGRWAVPGTTYGQSIEAIAQAISAG
jgi:N-acetylmuramoyl-L-alanine amidase